MNLIKSHENVKDIAILGDQTRLDGHYQGAVSYTHLFWSFSL